MGKGGTVGRGRERGGCPGHLTGPPWSVRPPMNEEGEQGQAQRAEAPVAGSPGIIHPLCSHGVSAVLDTDGLQGAPSGQDRLRAEQYWRSGKFAFQPPDKEYVTSSLVHTCQASLACGPLMSSLRSCQASPRYR